MTEAPERQTRISPLWSAGAPAGAHIAEDFGWRMVERYSDTAAEYRAVRETAGLIDLSNKGAIKVGGKEGPQFLQGLVTNDVKALARSNGLRCAFLTGHGKVKALAEVLSLGEEYLVVTDAQTHQTVFDYIFPFSYAGDFKVDDVSDAYRLLSVQGPKSILVMKEVCFEPVPALNEHQAILTTIAGYGVLVRKRSRTGEEGFDIHAPLAALKDVWDFVLLKGSFHSIQPIGSSALERLRLEAGVPVYGVDVDEKNMMLETGMADSVSFTKGCYTGQEAVAMATYRGHISKKLSGLRFAGRLTPPAGQLVFDNDTEIGRITSSVFSETLDAPIALAYLKYGFFEQGRKVSVRIDGEALEAEVVELPFYSSLRADI